MTTTLSLALGAPRTAGPLTLFPLFGPPPRLIYRTYADAAPLGAVVVERPQAEVETLEVLNKTDAHLLLYAGERLVGAQQDRVVEHTLLVAPGARKLVPVSCVEQGRWDGTRHHEPFAPAPHAADPELRRVKRDGGDQGQVWRGVSSRLAAAGVASASDKLDDLYTARRDELEALADELDPAPGQLGAIGCVSGRPVALDLVSRADAYASLAPRLTRGYALGALGRPVVRPDPECAEALLHDALSTGERLDHDGELIALTALPG